MATEKNRQFFKPMTPEQLRRNDAVLLIVGLAGLFFLLRDFYLSASNDIPVLGWAGYVTGPIFMHKVSEILLLILWGPVVWVSNYENSGLYPRNMPAERYYKWLRFSLIVAPMQIVLATYAWTIVNLGTSPLTTNYQPLSLGEEGWVWRYYLAAIIVAGVAFVYFGAAKVVKLSQHLQSNLDR